MIRPAMWAALLVLLAGPAAAAPPAWVTDLTAAGTMSMGSAHAVVLLDQVDVSVSPDGRIRTSRRYAVRIADRAGRGAAGVREVYLTGTGRVREIRGWILRGTRTVRELGGRDAVDMALVNNDVYNEVRVRALGAFDEVAAGDLFAAEVESDDRLLFAQLEWAMQGQWPAKDVRRTLTLPAGWRLTARTFNAPPIEGHQQGQTTTWRLRDVDAVPEEDAGAPFSDLAARLALSLFGPDGAPLSGQFETWEEVSAWLYRLADDGGRIAETVSARARETTEGAGTEFDKVAAIARFVQRIQYISIQTGIGRGGGYRPRPAALVLERSYGDCKDKASLMRAMLAAVGVRSYLVTIYAGDRKYVRDGWPSPQQFNHAVIAIALETMPPGVNSRVDHPSLGPLLVFDPTDEHTPLGDLPLHEQGSLALVVVPADGALLRMPVSPASAHAVERAIEGQIAANGTLTATVREQFLGASGASTRASYLALGHASFRAAVERRMAAAQPTIRVHTLEVENQSGSPFTLAASVEAGAYAQLQAGLLLLPMPFDSDEWLRLPAVPSRRTPLRLDPRVVRETIRLRVPTGFVVDELPEAVRVESEFGEYTVSFALEGTQLVATRRLEVPMQEVAPERYEAARGFFLRIRAADAAPAVLAKKPSGG
jgi:hypothetical protein